MILTVILVHMYKNIIYITVKILTVILTVILVHMYKNSIYITVKTFNSDFSPYV